MSQLQAAFAPDRRRVLKSGLTAGIGLGVTGLLAACSATTSGVGTDGSSTNGASGSPWAFTDDRGTKVSLTASPTRVVAYITAAAALYDFGVTDRIVGVFGPAKDSNGGADPMAGSLPVDKLTILGEAYGEFDMTKYAELNPQLLVTNVWEHNQLWYVPSADVSKVAKLAPTLGITVANTPLTTPLSRYETLAGLLGADLTASKVTDAKAAYQKAVESLRTTAKAQGTIKVMAASASADLFYVVDPKTYPDLSYFQELGVDFVVPNNVTGGFFESLSWENTDKYAADVILLDDRSSALQPKDLTGKPTWTRLPAVQANQVVGWGSELRYSYTAIAPVVDGVATALQKAKKVA